MNANEIVKALREWSAQYTAESRDLLISAADLIERQQAVLDKLPKEDGYYIASFKHGMVGNDVLFWGPNGGGYTCMLDEAGVYTREEALELHQDTKDDATYMLPAAWVRANFRCVIEIQRAGGKREMISVSRAAAETARHPHV